MQFTLDEQRIADMYEDESGGFELWSGSRHGGYHLGIARNFFDVFSNAKMLENLSELVIDNLSMDHETKKILDAGCGAGDIASRVKKHSDTAEVHGVTLSKKQIQIGNDSLRKRQISGVYLSHQSFNKMTFPNDYFDRAYYVESLCYGNGADKREALRECYRVLRPGGILVISDGFLTLDSDSWPKNFRYWNQKVLDTWEVREWINEKSFQRALQEIGFREIKDINLTKAIIPSIGNLLLRGFFSIPLQRVLEKLKILNKRELETLKWITLGVFHNAGNPYWLYKVKVIEKPMSVLLK